MAMDGPRGGGVSVKVGPIEKLKPKPAGIPKNHCDSRDWCIRIDILEVGVVVRDVTIDG